MLAIGSGEDKLENAMLAIPASQTPLRKRVDISQLEELERTPNPKYKSEGNFVVSRAVNMDNLPEKAQANQRK